MDNAKIDPILLEAAKSAGTPELRLYEEADDNFVPSDRFMRRMRRFIMIAIEGNGFIGRKITSSPLKRIAAAVLIVFAVTLCTALGVKSIRLTIFDYITAWRDRRIEIAYRPEDVVAPPETLLVYKEPTVGIEGYERIELTKNDLRYYVAYENETACIDFEQSIIVDDFTAVTNHGTTVTEVLINGRPAMLFSYTVQEIDYHILMWDDGEYKYNLSGNASADLLIRMAESVETVESAETEEQ